MVDHRGSALEQVFGISAARGEEGERAEEKERQ
jgi:hypothetical protein